MKKLRRLIDIEPDLLEWVESYAEAHYMSRNNVISDALKMYRKSKEEKTMQRVKLYQITITKSYMMSEQGTGFSLEPWGNNTDYYEGYDDGGKDYQLPEGYELSKTTSGEAAIFDNEGEYCDIVTVSNKPTLVTSKSQTKLKLANPQ